MAVSDSAALYAFDAEAGRDCPHAVVGVDEAGRGPLAGPVVAAAVQLGSGARIDGLNDSKKLTPARREQLYDSIVAGAPAWAVGVATPDEIDRLNILQASLLAMRRAIEQLDKPWSLALIDGNRTVPALMAPGTQQAVIGGDACSAAVAAASVVAKVTRDRMMIEYAEEFPAYSFEQHKGYPTALHVERIRTHGVCGIHRHSFCYKYIAQTVLPL
ncbi:MAG: ribonuclease HII [Chitinivibrionales bacterium]|nr:ribonuclease HII [Chitinivibrionales bacterium]